MDVHVGEMNSTVRVSDTAGLSPEVFQRIVQAVLAQAKEEMAREERGNAERKVRKSASGAV